MTFKSYFDHTEPVFIETQIINIFKINDYSTSLFMFMFLPMKKSVTTIQETYRY